MDAVAYKTFSKKHSGCTFPASCPHVTKAGVKKRDIELLLAEREEEVVLKFRGSQCKYM